jgi:hypothetical protein
LATSLAASHRLITILFAGLLALQSAMSAASPCLISAGEHSAMRLAVTNIEPHALMRASASVEQDSDYSALHAGHDNTHTVGRVSDPGVEHSLAHASADDAASACCEGGYCSQSGCTMPALTGLFSEPGSFSIAAPNQHLQSSMPPLAEPDSLYRPPSA